MGTTTTKQQQPTTTKQQQQPTTTKQQQQPTTTTKQQQPTTTKQQQPTTTTKQQQQTYSDGVNNFRNCKRDFRDCQNCWSIDSNHCCCRWSLSHDKTRFIMIML